MSIDPIHIVGGGLAGSEAAWQAALAGVPVILHEMRPVRGTDAHKTEGLAELVCSNSFRSDDAANNAVGLLHAEMRLAGSLIMASGDAHQVPAGGALAVDRDGFVLDVLGQSRRDAQAAKRLLRKLLKKQGWAPRVMVTKSPRQVQRFLSIHDLFANLFHLRRGHRPASDHRASRAQAFAAWTEVAGVPLAA